MNLREATVCQRVRGIAPPTGPLAIAVLQLLYSDWQREVVILNEVKDLAVRATREILRLRLRTTISVSRSIPNRRNSLESAAGPRFHFRSAPIFRCLELPPQARKACGDMLLQRQLQVRSRITTLSYPVFRPARDSCGFIQRRARRAPRTLEASWKCQGRSIRLE